MRWRTPITLVVLLGILLGAAYYGWHTIVSPATDSDTTDTTPPHHKPHKTPELVCVKTKTYPKGSRIKAGSFRVNVYNASSVSGRAAEVLAELVANGFQSGVAANPPAAVTATNVSILTSTPTSPRVQLVMAQFRGHVKLVAGPELDRGIDVIIGPEFVGVRAEAPDTYTVSKQTTICVTFAPKSTKR